MVKQACFAPALVLADMRPTLPLTASLEGVDIALIEAAYNQPDYPCSHRNLSRGLPPHPRGQPNRL